MHRTNSIPWQASQLSAWVIYQSAKRGLSCYQAYLLPKWQLVLKGATRAGGTAWCVRERLDADNCSSNPDFTKQHMSWNLPKVESFSLWWEE